MAIAPTYVVTQKYDPQDVIEYNELEGLVRITRAYTVQGAYPTTAIGIGWADLTGRRAQVVCLRGSAVGGRSPWPSGRRMLC